MILKQAGATALTEQLRTLRGERSQESMAEVCDISLRQYSNLERRCVNPSATTMLQMYAAGLDLNKWAEKALKLYQASEEEK